MRTQENIRIIINHVMDMHESKIRQLCKYGSMGERFRGFVLRWEQNNEPPPKEAPVEKCVSSSHAKGIHN